MEPFFLKNEQYFLIDEWTTDSLIAGFTTKNGGVSTNNFSSLNVGLHVHDHDEAVLENRRIVGNLLDFPLENWVGAEQTHDTNIVKIEQRDKGRGGVNYEDSFKETDGFFTKESGLFLSLCYADCVPLYFYSSKAHAIGIAHAGWRGTVQGIGREMVRIFEEEHVNLRDIKVVIGPSICENCYIVDERVIRLVQNILEHVEEKPYNLISGNQYHLNLQALNRQLLVKSGILEENIRISKFCTSCHEQYFFSHRRDRGRTGRMMSFIGWKEDSLRSK